MITESDILYPLLEVKNSFAENWKAFKQRHIIFNPYYWWDLKYKISCLVWHRNQWVIDCIPRTWMDKDAVFEAILYAGLVNYVEGEKCFETVGWNHTPKAREMRKMIKKIYKWIKEDKAELEEKIHAVMPKLKHPIKFPLEYEDESLNNASYEKRYGKADKLRKKMDDTDNKYLIWIVLNRGYLWT